MASSTVVRRVSASGGHPTGTTAAATGSRISETASPSRKICALWPASTTAFACRKGNAAFVGSSDPQALFTRTFMGTLLAVRAPRASDERVEDQLLEVDDQVLAARQEAALHGDSGAQAALDRVSEAVVLAAHLGIEVDHLAPRRLGDSRAEPVLGEAAGSLRTRGSPHVERQIGMAGIDAEGEIWPHVMVLRLCDRAAHVVGRLPAAALQRGAPHGRYLAREPAMRLQRIGVLVDVDHGAEPGVLDGAVVALQEVLDHYLPVGGGLPLLAVVEGEPIEGQPAVRDDRWQVAEVVSEGPGRGLEVHEHEGPPRVDCRPHERIVLRIEPRLVLRPRGRAEAAVETIRPCVVRTLKRPAVPGAADDLVPAVPAHVHERSESRLTAYRHDRDVGDRRREEIADLRDLVDAADVLPRAAKDAVALEIHQRRVDVPRGRKRDPALEVSAQRVRVAHRRGYARTGIGRGRSAQSTAVRTRMVIPAPSRAAGKDTLLARAPAATSLPTGPTA